MFFLTNRNNSKFIKSIRSNIYQDQVKSKVKRSEIRDVFLNPSHKVISKKSRRFVHQTVRPTRLKHVFFNAVSKRLPFELQTPFTWFLIKSLYFILFLFIMVSLIYILILKNNNRKFVELSRKYEYVYDERGHIMDIGYSPYIKSAKQAIARSQKLVNEKDD